MRCVDVGLEDLGVVWRGGLDEGGGGLLWVSGGGR